MADESIVEITTIVALGGLGQWLAWRLRIPAIVLLLGLGTLAGPVLGLLHPDEVFGELIRPFIALAVGLILFDGGLNLRFRELRGIGGVFGRLMTIGAAVTWGLLAVAGRLVLGLTWPVAALLACILTVTGPTVIGPILRHLRLRGRVASLLKWEGILIDPLGAILAVLVFAALEQQSLNAGVWEIGIRLIQTLLAGFGVGIAMGFVMVAAFARFWIPDFLTNPISLMLTLVAFVLANTLCRESGLLAVTVTGMVVANQHKFAIRQLLEFKEALTVLLISVLFVVLAARIRWEYLQGLGWQSVVFLLLVILVIRPVAVFVSTWGKTLSWNERLFLAGMAPRGVVAMAVASVAALALSQGQYEGAEKLVPVTLLVVFGTAAVYGLLAAPLARFLNLIQENPQGILFVGASHWVRELAVVLQREDCRVVLVDSNRQNVTAARLAGLPAIHGDALLEVTRESIDYMGLGRMLAVTSNNEVNSLACMIYAEDFGRQEVYQLPWLPPKEKPRDPVSPEHRGRLLFGKDLTYSRITEIFYQGGRFKSTKITKEFDFAQYRELYGDKAYPLFVLRTGGVVFVVTDAPLADIRPGDTVIALVCPGKDPSSPQPPAAAASADGQSHPG
ncbi:sodium/hydrogen exchanger [Thermogutta terrifontis]|uniref:Sodium/hydrogen exchanger n=1 Tax=Thermogutta terrifontis TaxID=1331910 RepID=A0A286RGU4_9BACT|nr:sodium:proton antiporter [Thermogutta terrifontis]ASV75178.1 sodium/hydrogen exchanger [Thermogutta terrifontis]